MSRILSNFINVIVSEASQFIYIPTNPEISRVIRDFQQISGLPKVIGAVDGSHIPLIAPPVGEYIYVNRKQFH